MKIDCISDLHGYYPQLPGGDLLIIAGDLTARNTAKQYSEFNDWVPTSKYEKVIVVGGNHDGLLQEDCTYLDPELTYLQDSGTEFQGKKIWGSPWTLTFEGINPHCTAFTVDTDKELAKKWAMIPTDIDILITHMPMLHVFDSVKIQGQNFGTHSVGSKSLRDLICKDHFPNLKLHICGHIHECGGQMIPFTRRTFVNASIVDEIYNHVHKEIRIEL